MAKYTIELRRIIDMYGLEEVKSWFMDYKLEDYLTSEEINVILNRGTWSKEKLANKIINHYFVREIGLETPALFKLYLKSKMNEIMEEMLPNIYSYSIKYDPLVNVDYIETYDRNIQGTTETNTNNTSSGITVNSDTPQGQINKNEILNGKYASNTSAGESENTSSGNDKSNTDENYTKRVKGNSGVSATAQALLKQYRDNVRAIDKEIIDRLNDLFMGLF